MWVKDSQRSDIQYWAPAANSAEREPAGAPPRQSIYLVIWLL